jgi:hypothetical protein
MSKHLNCTSCHKPIVLIPSAEERAAKCRDGKTANYYRNLFRVCATCQKNRWYVR